MEELVVSCQRPERTETLCDTIGLETHTTGWFRRATEYRDEALCVTNADCVADTGSRWRIQGFRECIDGYKDASPGPAGGGGDATWNVWECVRQ
jgi:hypothetical protein